MEVYSKVCTEDLFESDLVKYTNMEMTVMNEEVYTYRSPEMGFPCGSAGKESACNAGDPSSIRGLGGSPGEGKGYPLRYSGLENSRYRPRGCKELAVTERLSLSLVVVSPRNVLAHTQCDSLPASQRKWGGGGIQWDPQKWETWHTLQDHMGKNQGQPGGRRGEESMVQSRNLTGIFKGRNG